jgi:hypothetical protein
MFNLKTSEILGSWDDIGGLALWYMFKIENFRILAPATTVPKRFVRRRPSVPACGMHWLKLKKKTLLTT